MGWLQLSPFSAQAGHKQQFTAALEAHTHTHTHTHEQIAFGFVKMREAKERQSWGPKKTGIAEGSESLGKRFPSQPVPVFRDPWKERHYTNGFAQDLHSSPNCCHLVLPMPKALTSTKTTTISYPESSGQNMKFIGLNVSFFILSTLTVLWNAGAQDSCAHRCGELLGTCSCQVTCQSLGICCPDYKEFCLQISPYSGSLLGGKDFLINNTAFDASSVLKCRFKKEIITSGYIDKDGKAHCISPLLYETGFILFEVSTDAGLTFPYSGTWLSVHHSKVSDEEKCTLVNETKWQYYGTPSTGGNLTLTWTHQTFAATQVNIEVWGYQETGDSYSENWMAEWKYLYTLARETPNTGKYSFIPVPAKGNYSTWDYGILRIIPSNYFDGQRQVHHN
ncbi:hypothetical protein DV515_00009427 [Chloebia gouldiae]|uniref:SMB domain-containing protein n=1 Tax=Chloebia gouldiae TaxID=44316 RepID=A0A3L8SCA8_CHLGU|nr:hypothetical protein DV515_00009427 [Chloebia gouldiae]